MSSSSSIAWFVCGSVLAVTVLWPHLRELEGTAWEIHYDKCAQRARNNGMLLGSGLCDLGENELALQEKVNCAQARTEQAWGIWVCTVGSRLHGHSLAAVARHLWDSWYVSAAIVAFALYAIRGWFAHRTEVERHRISMDTLERLADDAASGRLGAPPFRSLQHSQPQQQQQQQQPRRHYEGRYGHYVGSGE